MDVTISIKLDNKECKSILDGFITATNIAKQISWPKQGQTQAVKLEPVE